ncbi:MAG: GldM family protein [Cyclobacteriaceae bacterium]
MKLPNAAFDVKSIRNLFLAGLSIWALTSVLYSIFSLILASLRSNESLVMFSLVVVVCLSIVCIILLSDYQLSSNFKSYGNLLSYALLLYFIANGFQAFYSAIQPPATHNQQQHAELIPFLDSRPWLPPAGMRKNLAQIRSEKEILYESEIRLSHSLDSAISRLESCGLMTDSIFLTVLPTSREIGKGGTFRSEVVLAARLDKSYVKRVSVNEHEIELKNGVAVFEESTGGINQLVRTLKYNAEIELYGEDQVITTSDSYRIIKPYIEVSSQAVNSLFLNCGNQLNIQVPVLGTDYRPTFKVNGGSFKYGNEPGKITVLPTSRQVDIDVYNQKAMLGKKSFQVRRIPAPSIRPFANGKQIDLTQGISKGTSAIALSVHSDAEFQRLLPADANYRVQDWEISLVSNGIRRNKMKGKGNTNISSLTKRAKAGDQLKIEIKTVLRKNFKGDIEKVVNFYPQFFLIPLK